MATPENLHKNIPNDQLHSPKDFSTAGSGTALRKGWDGDLKWEVPYWQDSVLDRVDMALAPPTEFDGDRYILINLTSTVVNADWDGASENDIVEYDLDASAWVSQTPFFDITARSQADLAQYYFDGTTWNQEGGGITNIVEDTTPQLGGTLDANGNIIDMGTNTITDTKVGNWDTAYGWGDHSVAGYLSNIVEDTTPQLGGDLDVQTNEIISTGANNIGLHSNASAYVELGDNLGSNSFDIRDNASGVKLQILSSGDTGIGKSTSLSTAWLSISTSNNNRAHINLEGSSVDKTTPVDGDLWYNTTAGTLNFYDGSTTTDLLAGGGGSSLWTDNTDRITDDNYGLTELLKSGATANTYNALAYNGGNLVVGTSNTFGNASYNIQNSIALGTSHTWGADGNIGHSMAVGSSLTVKNGNGNLITGNNGFVDGNYNVVHGQSSTGYGNNNMVFGNNIDIGTNTTPVDESCAMGTDLTITNDKQVLIGVGTTLGSVTVPVVGFGLYTPGGLRATAGFFNDPTSTTYSVNFAMGGDNCLRDGASYPITSGCGQGIFYFHNAANSKTVAPTTNVTDGVAMYAAERASGKMGLNIKGEDGTDHYFSDFSAIGGDKTVANANKTLTVVGTGTGSGTSSLQCEDSAGTATLEVRDDGVVIMAGLPTSATGLPTGALWNNSGVINIV